MPSSWQPALSGQARVSIRRETSNAWEEERVGYKGAGEEEPGLTVLRWRNGEKGSGFHGCGSARPNPLLLMFPKLSIDSGTSGITPAQLLLWRHKRLTAV